MLSRSGRPVFSQTRNEKKKKKEGKTKTLKRIIFDPLSYVTHNGSKMMTCLGAELNLATISSQPASTTLYRKFKLRALQAAMSDT